MENNKLAADAAVTARAIENLPPDVVERMVNHAAQLRALADRYLKADEHWPAELFGVALFARQFGVTLFKDGHAKGKAQAEQDTAKQDATEQVPA